MEYQTGSRDYLDRAKKRLAEDTPESTFYAAFELRCGIETRMREYLQAQEEVSKKKKEGWRIGNLGRDVERMFRTGDKIGQFIIKNADTGDIIKTLYYTPVTSSLRKKGEQLGNLLHASKQYRESSDAWWRETKRFLKDTFHELQIATKGTLLGVPLRSVNSNRILMNTEVLKGESQDPEMHRIGKEGGHIIMGVKYINALPLEP
jgi:hypothetical protein